MIGFLILEVCLELMQKKVSQLVYPEINAELSKLGTFEKRYGKIYKRWQKMKIVVLINNFIYLENVLCLNI